MTTALERGEHGTLNTYGYGCRCARCRRARRQYERVYWARRQVERTGSINRRVPVARAAEHIELLRGAGWTVRRIAEAAGCTPRTIDRIQWVHRAGRGRCWSLVEAAILGLVP